MIRASLVAALLMFLCGCESMNHFNPRDVRDGRWKHIRESGISQDASYVYLLSKANIKNGTIFFKPDSEKVTWWAVFTVMSFPSPYHVSFQAKWYDPNGEIFFEDDFGLELTKGGVFAKTSLPIAASPARNFPGLWQVEIYYQGHVIDRKKFHIVPADPENFKPSSQAQPRQETLSQLWAMPHPTPHDPDAFFATSFQKAKDYFHQGSYKESEACLTEILKKEPYRTEAHLALAALYFRQLQWDAVLKELDFVMQQPAYRDQALEVRAMVLEMKKHGKN